MDNIQKSLLDFCLSLLDDSTESDEIDRPLIIALAVLGVTSTGFLGPDRYPSILSAVLKIGRFFVLRTCYENSTTEYPKIDIDNSDDSDDSITSDTSSNDKSLRRLKTMIDRFMIRGSHTPMDWLLDLRAYGMNIARNTTTTGQID